MQDRQGLDIKGTLSNRYSNKLAGEVVLQDKFTRQQRHCRKCGKPGRNAFTYKEDIDIAIEQYLENFNRFLSFL